MDDIDLVFELRARVPTLQDCPRFLRGDLRSAYMGVLSELRAAYDSGQEDQILRAWKMFLLTARMLLARPQCPRHPARRGAIRLACSS